MFYPHIYTQEHLDKFLFWSKDAKKYESELEAIKDLPSIKQQVTEIAKYKELLVILDDQRQIKNFAIVKAIIESHKRTVKMRIFYFSDKILQNYELMFTPTTRDFDTSIKDLETKIRNLESDLQLFDSVKEDELADLKNQLQARKNAKDAYLVNNPPLAFNVGTLAHKRKPDCVEFEFFVSKEFIELLNESIEDFPLNYRVELNKQRAE